MKARILAFAVALGLSILALNTAAASAAVICGPNCRVDPDGFCSCEWFYCNGHLQCGIPY